MSFSAVIAIPFFLSLFYRTELAKFLAPLWIAIYILSEGFLFTLHGFVTFVSCVVVAIFVIFSMFFKGKSDGKRSENVSIFDEDDTESAPTESSPARIKRTRIKVFTGVIESFGIEHWKNDPSNDRSFFVKLEGQTPVWAKGLKDAIDKCGAKEGDRVSFWKENEIRTDHAQQIDDNGKVIGYRKLETEKRRGFWRMELDS